MTTYGKDKKKRSHNKDLRQVWKREDEQSALDTDAGHPSEEATPNLADEGDDRANRLASVSSALAEGGEDSSTESPRARAARSDALAPPSASASEGCQPQCGPNSPLGGRARTPGEVAEDAWSLVNAVYLATFKR